MSEIFMNFRRTVQAEIENFYVNATTIRSNPEVTQPKRTTIYTLALIALATTIAVIGQHLCGCGVYSYLPSAEIVIPTIALASLMYAISLVRDIKQPEPTPPVPAGDPQPQPKPWSWMGTFCTLGIGPLFFPQNQAVEGLKGSES